MLQKCKHHILTFEFHNKLKSRPNTEKWPAIPETRKFHSIGNTQNCDVYLRTFSCCCKGCLHGNESCSNDVCPDKWRGYSLAGRKYCEPNRSWWCETSDDQICKSGQNTHLPSEINWQNRIAVLSAINSFEELVTFVNNNPLPCFMDEINDTITQQEIHNLDIVALHYIPDNAPQRIAPLSVKGDGNCFPRTISYLLCKSQSRYMEMRVRIVYEAVINLDSYLDNNYVSVGHVIFMIVPPSQSSTAIPLDVLDLYKKEVMDIRKDGAFMRIWQIFQASNVLKRPIRSVFPICKMSIFTF